MRRILWVGISVVTIFFLSFVILYMQSGNPHDKTSKIIEILPGESAKVVAQKLKDSGIVHGETGWLLALKFVGGEDRIQAGRYTLSPSRSTLDIILTLTKGDIARPDLLKITFPEGASIYKMGVRLKEAGALHWFPFQEMVEAKIPTAFLGKFPFLKDVPTFSLEGYLFPDTYKFDPKIRAEDLAELMLSRFSEVILPMWEKEKGSTRFSLHELLTLASIVEKEAQIPEERSVIASVFINRLKIRMKLDADPTVKYSLEAPQKIVRYKDLKVESPYNTYLNPGLPPGPICNPGLASVLATLHPADTQYLYFVADPTGHHIFSKTHEDHLRARKKLSSKEYSP